MKKAILIAAVSVLTLGVNAGDWGKAPVPAKAPIEECVDIGGTITAIYVTDYVYQGLRLGRDSVVTDVNYGIDSFIPLTIGATHKNVIGGAPGIDHSEVYLIGELGTVAGFDLSASYKYHFYSELGGAVGSAGEIGVHIARDLGFATFKSNVLFNHGYPNSWNAVGGNNNDDGAWYYDFVLEKTVAIGPANLVLSGGVAYADNYWGRSPNAQTGGRSSGWNHYYVTAALPIELNCRATLTPFIGYSGAPDSWLMDGVGPITPGLGAQSDILHGGVSLSVSF